MKQHATRIITKTFGGLRMGYYLRHLVFGAALSALIIIPVLQHPDGVRTSLLFIAVLNALLYPYSRFVYESVMNFITGDNIFIVNTVLLLMVKFITMTLCWGLAIFIAPVGLLYLYYYHSKQEKALHGE